MSKKQDGHSITIVDRIKEVAEGYRETRLPPGAAITFTNDSSDFIKDILSTLKMNAWMGMLLVAVTLFIFLGWRQAAFAVVGIPVALALTFVFLRFTGHTVNGSSLFGLVLVLGMLVDDAIVVIENCFRYMELGMPARQAAVVGTREVMVPVLTSAGTTMAAFLPLMLLPGVIGDFMRIIPAVVSMALAASLFESFFILPSHVAEWSGKRKRRERPLVDFSGVRHLYRRLLARTIRRRYWVLGGATLLILASLPIAFTVGVDMFADEEVPFFFVYATMPEGTRLDATDATLAKLERIARESIPGSDLKHVRSVAGMQETEGEWIVKPSVGELVVELRDKNDRRFEVEELMNRMREKAEWVPGIQAIEFHRVSSGPPTGAPVEVKVRGDHLDELSAAAEEVKTTLAGMDGVKDIRDDFLASTPELRVKVDEEKAAMYGLTVAQVASTVHAAFQGRVATQFLEGDDDIDVLVRLDKASRSERIDLSDLIVVTPTGRRLYLKDVADIREEAGYATIKHDEKRRAITVTANVDKRKITGVEANQRLMEYLAVDRPPPSRLRSQVRRRVQGVPGGVHQPGRSCS